MELEEGTMYRDTIEECDCIMYDDRGEHYVMQEWDMIEGKPRGMYNVDKDSVDIDTRFEKI
jgi:hypothetical protein